MNILDTLIKQDVETRRRLKKDLKHVKTCQCGKSHFYKKKDSQGNYEIIKTCLVFPTCECSY